MLLLFPCSLFLDHVFSGVGPRRALIKVITVMLITVMDLHPVPAQHCCFFFLLPRLPFHPICKRKYGTHLECGENQGMR